MKKAITLFSSEEAARMLGITRQGLAHRVKKGKIRPASFIKSKYQFFEKEIIKEALYNAMLKISKRKK